jgi:lipoprotein-anchoring transpeptidase ErfK/SrfK
MTTQGVAFILTALLLVGCVQPTRDPATDTNLTPRDRRLLANPPYARITLPAAYQRTVVQFHRKEAPDSIVINPDARYLYYVLAGNKAIRYGVAVGEQALSWYGVAKRSQRRMA